MAQVIEKHLRDWDDIKGSTGGHVLQAPVPPAIQSSLAITPVISKNVWGIYVLVLQKPGHQSCVYIGSSTGSLREDGGTDLGHILQVGRGNVSQDEKKNFGMSL